MWRDKFLLLPRLKVLCLYTAMKCLPVDLLVKKLDLECEVCLQQFCSTQYCQGQPKKTYQIVSVLYRYQQNTTEVGLLEKSSREGLFPLKQVTLKASGSLVLFKHNIKLVAKHFEHLSG